MTAYLDLEKVNVSYDTSQVLFDVSLKVDKGAFIAVAGPSGCGKTTLLRTILGLERASTGNIRLGKKMLTTHGIHLAPEKRKIGWVPQDAALFPMLTVAENIAFSLAKSPRGVKKQAQSQKVHELLELINMTDLASRMPHELSGGQAQRVALARALASEPNLVLMDEPFAGLDPVLRPQLRAEVKSILKASNTTALLVTHDQTEALSIADKIALLHNGRIEQFGLPEEVYNTPASIWVADFMGESNRLVAQRKGKKVQTILGTSEYLWMGEGEPRDEFDVIVRPESLKFAPGKDWKIAAVEYCGHDALITARHNLDGNSLDVRVPAEDIKPIGAQVGIKMTGPLLGYSQSS
jgi:iron(III) transport system ATP-binding protein